MFGSHPQPSFRWEAQRNFDREGTVNKLTKNECLYGYQVAQVLWGCGNHEVGDGGVHGGRRGASDGV